MKLACPKFETSAGITVAKILNLNGVPTITHSPDADKTWHIADEFVKIENLEKCSVLWNSLIYELVKLITYGIIFIQLISIILFNFSLNFIFKFFSF